MHAADDLALEALCVEVAFTRDHELTGLEHVVQVELVGHEVEAGHQASAQRCQRASEATGRTPAFDLGHIDTELRTVHLDQAIEASGQHPHLRR